MNEKAKKISRAPENNRKQDFFRGKKVMLDRDLATLYGVETRALNQAVRRNVRRFPEDFMFQLTKEELESWKSQIVISNREKHGITYIECEEVFFNSHLVMTKDEPHSVPESRYYILGKTNNKRLLYLVFTLRGDKIRVISARDMSKKERKIYEQIGKDT